MSKYSRIPLEKLIVLRVGEDPEGYQRPEDERFAGQIASNYDEDRVGTLDVVPENGHFPVVDGQTRLAALRILGFKDAPCLVHPARSRAAQAELFVRLNTNRRPVHQIDRFYAQLRAGDKVALAIDRQVSEQGFVIGRQKSRNGDFDRIGAVSTLATIARRYGEEMIGRELRSVRDLWLGDVKATSEHFLFGLAHFLAVYGDRLSDDRIERLGAASPTTIWRRATSEGQGMRGVTANLVGEELRRAAGFRKPR